MSSPLPTSSAPLRPALHLTPPVGWMNDPNGLVKVGDTWHAYFQHDPEHLVHPLASMHWGHASSQDLLHWDHHPIAVHPDELGVIFSGSAVIDTDDTAGFGAGAVVAIFTHFLDGKQSQSLAYSNDGGTTFTKYADNPVLEADKRDFRDPKVERTPTGWSMVLAAGKQIEFYESSDLRRWEQSDTYAHTFGTGLDAGIWECPDLIQFPESTDPARTHLLTFCIVGGPADSATADAHSPTVYVPGAFRDGVFTPADEPRPLDHGPDAYASQSFHALGQSAPVLMSWMSSWKYANVHPERGYRGTMSMPRRLTLDGGTVRQSFVLDGAASTVLAASDLIDGAEDSALLITAPGDLQLTLVGPNGIHATVTIQHGVSATLARHEAALASETELFSAPLPASGSHQILIDHGTIEVLAGDGAVSLSALTFADPDWHIELDGTAAIQRLS